MEHRKVSTARLKWLGYLVLEPFYPRLYQARALIEDTFTYLPSMPAGNLSISQWDEKVTGLVEEMEGRARGKCSHHYIEEISSQHLNRKS